MNSTCPTVRVVNSKGGYVIINQSDFDDKIHTLFEDKPKPKPKAKKAD